MAALSITDKLQAGGRYTFRFQTQAVIVTDSVIVDALTVAYSFLSNVTESRELFGSHFSVSFTWNGVPTSVGDVAGNMVQILSPLVAPVFLDAEGGDVVQAGSPSSIVETVTSPLSQAGQSVADTVSNFFSGLKTATISIIIGIVAIVVLVLILVAYGPNVKHIAGAL